MSAALEACEALVRRHDPERYLATLFAPLDKRRLLFALYAFNYEIARIAESVREPMLGEIRREWWREAIDSAAKGAPRRHDVVEALAEIFAQSQIGPEPFIAIIDARSADAQDETFATLAGLEAYAGDTAGKLAAIAAQILSGNSLEAARSAGTAYGLTGLLRGVPFHAARRKLFLPRTLLDEAKIPASQLLERHSGANLAPVFRRIADRAQHYLETARASSSRPAALPALLPAACCALSLRRMTSPGFDPFRNDSEIALWRKQLAMLIAATRGRL